MSIKSGFTKLSEGKSIPNMLATLFASIILVLCVYHVVYCLRMAEVNTEKVTQEVFVPPVPVTFVETTKTISAVVQDTLDEKIFWEISSGSKVEVMIARDKFDGLGLTYFTRFADGKIAIIHHSKFDPKPNMIMEEGMPFFLYEPVACKMDGNRIIWDYQWKPNFVLGTCEMLFVIAVVVGLSWFGAWIACYALFFIWCIMRKVFRPRKRQVDG